MKGACLVVLLGVALAAGSAPAGAAVVEIRDGDGHVVGAASDGSFAYPASAAAVEIGTIVRSPRFTELRDVRLLAGLVTVRRMILPVRGFAGAWLVDLRVAGRARDVAVNGVELLGQSAYLVELQEAIAPGHEGLVGLRLHLLRPRASLPAGSELLVGIPTPADASAQTPADSVLALAGGPTADLAGGDGFAYPLVRRGMILGCPFALGSTHSPLVPPDNLESDDAVDILAPIGTSVVAVADGVIGSELGFLGSLDLHLEGQRVHLDTTRGRFYDAHLGRIDVYPGEHLTAGEQIGVSGVAAGVPHRQIAQDGGEPCATRSSCSTPATTLETRPTRGADQPAGVRRRAREWRPQAVRHNRHRDGLGLPGGGLHLGRRPTGRSDPDPCRCACRLHPHRHATSVGTVHL